MAAVLVLARLCEPSSELHIAEDWYRRTALEDLLALAAPLVNDDRLYRALDRLLPHKRAVEQHLVTRLGELFALDYDLLLYDVTSTYFEGLAEANPLAQGGHSRDHRSDCKQVCLALVVTREGLPLGYEVFAGNRAAVTTVEDIVEAMEARYGLAQRIWVMDRGMTSEDNLEWLGETGRGISWARQRVSSRRGRVRSPSRATGGWYATGSRPNSVSARTGSRRSCSSALSSVARKSARCTSGLRTELKTGCSAWGCASGAHADRSMSAAWSASSGGCSNAISGRRAATASSSSPIRRSAPACASRGERTRSG